jgi:hypothetical protein
MPSIPTVRVGAPLAHEALNVFPLFLDVQSDLDYRLSDEALADGTVKVEEVSEAGSVPTLLVDNPTDRLVLFLEGEELRGAKQNRVLNTSVLIAPKSRTTLPVSCVESGRWRFQGRGFRSSGYHSSSKLRTVLKKSVSASSLSGHGHSSDQSEVWREVSRQMESLGSTSDTMAMAATYDSQADRFAEFRAQLPYLEDASGLAVAIGQRIVSVDLFDRAQTCEKVWDRLLSGLVLDALEAGDVTERADEATVNGLLTALREARWKQVPAAGSGEEYRAEEADRHASALTANGSVVHASLVTAG